MTARFLDVSNVAAVRPKRCLSSSSSGGRDGNDNGDGKGKKGDAMEENILAEEGEEINKQKNGEQITELSEADLGYISLKKNLSL